MKSKGKYPTNPTFELTLIQGTDAGGTVPKRFAATAMSTVCCFDCGGDSLVRIAFLILKPDIQRQIASGGKAILCPECIEKRLGRSLESDDLDSNWLAERIAALREWVKQEE
jgi:hypothetical protein